MARHNALQMLGRSGNPALSANTFKNEGVAVGQVMTLQGTVNKTGILLALLILTASYTWNVFFQTGNPAAVVPAMMGGAIGGLILALITIFKKKWAGITAPVYALLQGLFLGGVSAHFEAQYPRNSHSSHRTNIRYACFTTCALQARHYQTNRKF